MIGIEIQMIGMREIRRTARERMKKLGKLCVCGGGGGGQGRRSRFEGEIGGRGSEGGGGGKAV